MKVVFTMLKTLVLLHEVQGRGKSWKNAPQKVLESPGKPREMLCTSLVYVIIIIIITRTIFIVLSS